MCERRYSQAWRARMSQLRERRALRKVQRKLSHARFIEEKVIFAGKKGLFIGNFQTVLYTIYIIDYSEKSIIYEISEIRKQIPEKTLLEFRKLINLNVENKLNTPALATITC